MGINVSHLMVHDNPRTVTLDVEERQTLLVALDMLGTHLKAERLTLLPDSKREEATDMVLTVIGNLNGKLIA